MAIDTRSTNDEFGWKTELNSQDRETLTGADFGKNIDEPSIEIDGDPEAVMPVAAADRPLYLSKSKNRVATASFKQKLTRGILTALPSWMTLLEAAGWTLSGSVMTMGARPSNSKSITCELFDGIVKKSAWGVRGNPEIVADQASGMVRMGFTGKGHGIVEAFDSWPTGISDDTTPHAIFEDNEMTIAGFTPELVKCSFKGEGDPVIVPDALRTDGFVHPWLTGVQYFLRPTILMHTLEAKDWYAYITGSADANKFGVSWGINLGGGKEAVIAGQVGLAKHPTTTRENSIGVFPLEFQFLRGTDITITYRDKT